MRKLLLLTVLTLNAGMATAQLRLPHPKPRIPVHPSQRVRVPFEGTIHRSRASVCLPGVFLLTPNGGISFGLDYERCLGKNGRFSAGLSGRMLMGLELRNSMVFVGFGPLGQRVSGGAAALTGAYHPLGNRRRLDLGIGGGLLLGRVRTQEETGAGAPFFVVRQRQVSVPVASFSLIVNTRSSFTYGLLVRGGPVLNRWMGGGGMLEAGLRIGTQF